MKELIINEVFFAVLEGLFIFLIFASVMINEKRAYINEHKHKVLLFIVLYTIFSFWITLSYPIIYHTLIITFFTGIVLSVITKNNIIMAIVAVIIATILIIIIESILVILLSLTFKIDINDIIINPGIKTMFSIIAKAVQITIGVLLYRSNLKPIIKDSSSKEKTNLLNYSILGIFMMTIFFTSLHYIINNPKDLLKYEVLLFFIFLVYVLFGLFDFRDRIKLLTIKNKYTLQIEYINNLEAVVNILRREKHDYLNHLNAINAICTLNKPNSAESIKNYVGKLADDLKESYKIFDTGNVYIDGLLVVKSNFAHENSIGLDVEIEAPLSCLDIKDNDIISVISNILDNAFDSITSSENHDSRVVSLCTYIEGNEYFVSIANTGPKIPEDMLPKIFENGFSTKPQKSEHGLGLYIVNNLVKKYDGHIEAYSSDIETQFLIKFPLKDEKHG